MYSCGKSEKDRKDDISNILSNKTCDNTAASDIYFCDDKSAGNCSEVSNLDYDPGSHLMKYGTYISTIFFLSLGLLFTIVAQIFSVLNVCHTPIDLIYGTHGLVAWNAFASKQRVVSVLTQDQLKRVKGGDTLEVKLVSLPLKKLVPQYVPVTQS